MPSMFPEDLEEKQAALARYNEANGLGPMDPKVARLERQSPPAAPTASARDKRRKRHCETDEERRNRAIEQYRLKHLAKQETVSDYDVTKVTRYPEVKWPNAGEMMLHKILKRYAHVMKPQGITPADFKNWRQHFMLMSHEQLAELIRVTPRTIQNWESGESRIPFSMWWVMHVTLQDPEYFLTRPGFHDFYIEYVEGRAHLCSYSHPSMRFSISDLYISRCALDEVESLRKHIERQEKALQELTAENTHLRQLMKAEGLTDELQAMQERLAALMKRINTADVVPFQPSEEAATAVAHTQRAA